jgi:peptidoglycan hydrolase-like protein with peptidoglycan-binding domain
MQFVTGFVRCVLVVTLCAITLSGCVGPRYITQGIFSPKKVEYRKIPDRLLCDLAVEVGSESAPKWDLSLLAYVQEAQRRGFSTQRCAELTRRGLRVASSNTQSSTPVFEVEYSKIADRLLCDLAVEGGRGPEFKWDLSLNSYVQEAQRRGFSMQRCAELAGRLRVASSPAYRRPAPSLYSEMSNLDVCIQALTPTSQPLSWDIGSNFVRHIQEAARRGLTLQRCAELTGRHAKSAVVASAEGSAKRPVSASTEANATQTATQPSDLVKAVQKRLAAFGYTPGPSDGVVGRKTRNAIEAFQRDEGLPATGEPTPMLAKLMETKLASTLVQPKPATPPPTAPHQTADLGTFHALVIGNNMYRHLPKLRTAVADAQGVTDILRDRYGFKVTPLYNATRDQIIDALDDLRSRLTDQDNLLIFYGGHGYLDPSSDRGYWQGVDAEERTRSRWISNGDITDALKAIRARQVIVIADSCYSGTLARSAQRGVSIQRRGPDYLATLIKKKARTVLSSGSLEPVSDSGGIGHSVFARGLLTALEDNTGVMDGTQLYMKVREYVRLNANQTPLYSNIRMAGHEPGGDFLFARKRE